MSLVTSSMVGDLVAGAAPANPLDPVAVPRPGGQLVSVFDTVTTALACMEQMRLRKQTFLRLGEVRVATVSYYKLLLYVMTPDLALFEQTYAPIYAGGQVLFAHKQHQTITDLKGALSALGVQVLTDISDNASLAAAGLTIQIVDQNYQANAPAGLGSQLQDVVPLRYAYVAS